MITKLQKLKFAAPFVLLSIVTFVMAISLVALDTGPIVGLYVRIGVALVFSILLAIVTALWLHHDMRQWFYSNKLKSEQDERTSEEIKSERQEVAYLAQIYEEMTDELKNQKAQTEKQKRLLEEARTRVEVILSSVPDGVATINEDGKIYSWNAGAEAITLYNDLNTIGSPYYKIMTFTDKTGTVLDKDATPIAECLTSKKTIDRSDLFLRSRLDKDVPIDIKVAPIFDIYGNILAVTAAFRDVSKKREIEQAKEDFLATVTHDLKSPLASIVGYTNILLHPKANFSKEEQHEYLHIILGSVKTLQLLIDNILVSARHESGQIVYQFDDFDLKTLMREIQIMFTPLVDSKNINFIIEGEPIWIYGDKEKIRQVINNLVSNAIKFTPEQGSIVINYKKTPECAIVSVADTGKGIPEDQIGKLFNKFVQVKGEKRGTGLGLYNVKKLLEDHRQYITIESTPSKGTEFTFTLGYGSPKEDLENIGNKDKKVLIVEDIPEVSNLLKYLLKEAGYSTIQAFNGKDAISLIETEKPDLITLDFNLPDMTGREIIEKSNARKKKNPTPVLLVTANSPSKTDFYDRMLGKPVDETRFIDEVARLLNKTSMDSVEVLK